LIVDREEHKKWLLREQEKVHKRYVCYKLNRKNPRSEKVRDFRKSRSPLNTGNFAKKESPWAKKAWKNKVRMKLKENLLNESYYNVYSRDYKSYGWITW